MTDRCETDNRWDWSDLHSLREAFFADSPQPRDAAGWLEAEHRFAEHLATSTKQWSPHWDNFDMDGELRDRENAGTILALGNPEDRAFIAYQDPAAVLRRIEAERELLASCSKAIDIGRRFHGDDYLNWSPWSKLALRTALGLAKAWGWEPEQ